MGGTMGFGRGMGIEKSTVPAMTSDDGYKSPSSLTALYGSQPVNEAEHHILGSSLAREKVASMKEGAFNGVVGGNIQAGSSASALAGASQIESLGGTSSLNSSIGRYSTYGCHETTALDAPRLAGVTDGGNDDDIDCGFSHMGSTMGSGLEPTVAMPGAPPPPPPPVADAPATAPPPPPSVA